MKRKSKKRALTGFEELEAAGGWKRFWGRVLQAYGECFFSVLMCTLITIDKTTTILWGFIVVPGFMVLGSYYRQSEYYKYHDAN